MRICASTRSSRRCAISVPWTYKAKGIGLAYRVAADNLRLGVSAVADSCNPIELTRREWERVALETQARYVNIEVVCSDPIEHRRRVETRSVNVPGLKLPTWDDVENREYDAWTVDRIVIDTAKPLTECIDELLAELTRL